MKLGTYIEIDGRPAVQFERIYAQPEARVWAAVTESEQLSAWFPSTVEFEPKIQGDIRFSDPNIGEFTGTVLAYEPLQAFGFAWGTDEVHFELNSLVAGRTRLTLTNILSDQSEAARNAAGWGVCLVELDKLVDGRHTDGPHSENAEKWQAHYDAHLAAGLPSGAPIPS
jgi:uncharacterized protein YndB with AHSA1/START domain